MSPDIERLKELLAEASALTSPEERAAYLERVCAGDLVLRAELERLIRAQGLVGEFLESPVLPGQPEAIGEGPGMRIGRYLLLEQIGEGGFGRVFRAEQEEPLRREVALKIVKAGMDTREVIARFEAERQALAFMDHPNIARVLDAGATESGRPYFVMELVKGVPLTEYCDQSRLSTEQRLGLFLQVCRGIQHAHQKGIIHRDLKPANILVTVIDGRPVPKIIDFGVAKALGPKLTEKTVFTAFQQMIGTPAYMSPEQAELSGMGVDTRSDIYSLGVLLYELLTGVTPHDDETLRKAALDEIRRIIGESEPLKPSTRLKSLGPKLTEVALRRQTEPTTLPRLVTGDLDWIVMKSLEKDQTRRYETVEALGQDLERHLRHEPVQAGPPGRLYRLGKFIRRHRIAVAMSGVVLAVLIIGLIGTLVGLVRARSERDHALAAEKEAQIESAIADAVNRFLTVDLLAQASPYRESDHEITLRTLLDRAAAKITDQFVGEPLVEAQIRWIIGWVYMDLDDYKNAALNLARAKQIRFDRLGAKHPKTIEAEYSAALLILRQGKYAEAQIALQRVVDLSVSVLGSDHTNTLSAVYSLGICLLQQGNYAESQKLIEACLVTSRRVLGPTHEITQMSMNALGILLGAQGKHEEEEKVLEQLLETQRLARTTNEAAIIFTTVNLGWALQQQGRSVEAEKLFQQSVAQAQKVFGPDHLETLKMMTGLARAYASQGESEKAKGILEQIVTSARKSLGPDHPETVKFEINLIECQPPGQCLESCEQLLPRARRALGPEHPIALACRRDLVAAYHSNNKDIEARALLRGLPEAYVKVLGLEHPDTFELLTNTAGYYSAYGNTSAGRNLIETNLTLCRHALGELHQRTLELSLELAWQELLYGTVGQAERHCWALLESNERALGKTNIFTLQAHKLLALAYGLQAQWERARTELQHLREGDPQPETCSCQAVLSLLANETEAHLQKCREMFARFGDTKDDSEVALLAEASLVSPNPSAWQLAFPLIDRAVTNSPELKPYRLEKPWLQLLKGIAEYRAGRPNLALHWLEHWDLGARHAGAACKDDSLGSWQLDVLDSRHARVSLAQAFLALAHHQLGHTNKARECLSAAQRLHRSHTQRGIAWADSFVQDAAAAVVLAEAERVIFGRKVSPELNSETLSATRTDWERVRVALRQGQEFSQQGQWPEAAAAFAAALNDTAFDWDAAECELPCVHLWIGVAFYRAGDKANYTRLCRNLDQGWRESPLIVKGPSNPAKLCLLSPSPSPELLSRAGNIIARELRATDLTEGGKAWLGLARGMLEYRTAAYEEAFFLFEQAAQNEDVFCRGPALLLQAMTAKRLGRSDEAECLRAAALALAPAILAELDFPPNVPNLEIFRLVQDECDHVLASDFTPPEFH